MSETRKPGELFKTSKTKEELKDSIKEAGVELSDEEMEAVAGGVLGDSQGSAELTAINKIIF
ncbi:MAG: hypothetical protein E7300_12320 [Lachnospiraceae bacterium]|nr:hypothetical protein [Lachnospiraceae bacterium]